MLKYISKGLSNDSRFSKCKSNVFLFCNVHMVDTARNNKLHPTKLISVWNSSFYLLKTNFYASQKLCPTNFKTSLDFRSFLRSADLRLRLTHLCLRKNNCDFSLNRSIWTMKGTVRTRYDFVLSVVSKYVLFWHTSSTKLH